MKRKPYEGLILSYNQPTAHQPKHRTLEDELDAIRSHHHGCYHEEDITDEVIHEVERVLQRFGLLQIGMPDDPVFNGCWFCGSKDYTLTHKHFCVEKSE